MAIIRRRFPNFVDPGPDQITEHNVNSLQDLLEIDWLQKGREGLDDFVQYSVSGRRPENLLPLPDGSNYPEHLALMAEHEDSFWAVAHFIEGDLEDLPTFVHPDRVKSEA